MQDTFPQEPPPLPQGPAVPPPASKVGAFGRALADALRLTFFLRVADDRPTASWGAILAIVAASILWPTLLALPSVGLQGQYAAYSLGDALVHVPLVFLAAIAAGVALGRRDEIPRFVAAGFLVSILLDFAQMAAALAGNILPAGGSWIFWVFPAWLGLALGVHAARRAAPGVRRLAALAVSVLLMLPLANTFRDRVLWQPVVDREAMLGGKNYTSAATEEVFYRQPELLRQALDAIQPGRPGTIDVFFVAMGGYADQDVFRREVDATTRMMEERFGAAGHTIRLVNNRGTLNDLPIASRSSLKAALNRIGSVMDKDEDILVLFMTSHGSSKHVFTLQLWPLQFDDLDPQAVRALLDESGIRNRVVVVSACYSGGFMKPLEDAHTLVVTAAAADKTSFGCSNEAEWTYFGRAYFDEALRKTYSFTKAYEMARPVIHERELKVRADVSDPQASVGAAIGAKLAALERQLEGKPAEGAPALAATAKIEVPRDKYVEYVDLMLRADHVEQYRKSCLTNMAQRSPDETIRKHPDTFWGLERSPDHWRRLRKAWSDYSETFCAQANDLGLLRETYLQKVRSVMREPEIDAALAFIRTPAGMQWHQGTNEVGRQQNLELGRRQADLNERLYKAYREAEEATLADFRKTR